MNIFLYNQSIYCGRFGNHIAANVSPIKALPMLAYNIVPKLDVVGPFDNRPSTDYHHKLVREKMPHKKIYSWHVTHDM